MRPANALLALCLATVLGRSSYADVILLLEPSTIEVGQPTQVLVSLTAVDLFTLSVDRLAFAFDGGSFTGGISTDPGLKLSEFIWLSGLGDRLGVCSDTTLPRPYSDCLKVEIPFGKSLPIANITVTAAEIGVYDLASNLRLRNAADATAVTVAEGDPFPIKVVPEPAPLTLLCLAFGLVARRRYGGNAGGRRAQTSPP